MINILAQTILQKQNPQFESSLMQDPNFVPFTISSLNFPHTPYTRDLLWLLSLIFATQTNKEQVFKSLSEELFKSIVQMAFSQDYAVKSEALICLYNICENA
jgi:hypothetical protein